MLGFSKGSGSIHLVKSQNCFFPISMKLKMNVGLGSSKPFSNNSQCIDNILTLSLHLKWVQLYESVHINEYKYLILSRKFLLDGI